MVQSGINSGAKVLLDGRAIKVFLFIKPSSTRFFRYVETQKVRKPTLPLKFDELLLGSIDLFEALQYFYMHTIRDSVKSFFWTGVEGNVGGGN